MSAVEQARSEKSERLEASDKGRRATVLLAIGAATGLALATVSLVSDRAGVPDPLHQRVPLPENSVARVNDTLIAGADFERLVAGLERDTRAPANAEMRRHILDRMIDEELLVQHGLELGLARVDRRVRADLTSALISSVVDESDASEPTQRELRAFYSESRDLFTNPGRLHARQIFFAANGEQQEDRARERARQALGRLASGESFAEVRGALGDAELSPLPDAYLPATKLREYLGPTALRALMVLGVGERTPPLRSGTGVHVLELLGREPPQTPAFEEIEKAVKREWRRQAGDRALRAYLDDLRDRAVVVTRQGLP